MTRLKIGIFALILASMTTFATYGIRKGWNHWPLFQLDSVQVVWLNSQSIQDSQIIDDHEVKRRLNIPLSHVGLLGLDLSELKKNLLLQDWFQTVELKRLYPHTLKVSVRLRSPRGLLQLTKDSLRYVDPEGVVFGHPDLKSLANLPVFSGFTGHAEELKQALRWLDQWDASVLVKTVAVSSLHFDVDRGFRIVASYSAGKNEPLKFKPAVAVDNKFRTIIELGQEIDVDQIQKITSLGSVFKYLSENSVSVRQIWAELDKKIVVKTAHGS